MDEPKPARPRQQESDRGLEQRAQRVERLASLATRLSLRERRERQRLARILHDDPQQVLSAAAFCIEKLLRHPTDDGTAELERLRSLIDRSISATRTLCTEISPPLLFDLGLAEALSWLARQFEERDGLRVTLTIAPGIEVEDEDCRILLFESIREALTNVVKHAGVRSSKVELMYQGDDRLRVSIRDQGVGASTGQVGEDSERDGGLGLLAIREWMASLGGNLVIESMPGQGMTLILSLPCSPSTDKPEGAG